LDSGFEAVGLSQFFITTTTLRDPVSRAISFLNQLAVIIEDGAAPLSWMVHAGWSQNFINPARVIF
jgi:hypothetical protein